MLNEHFPIAIVENQGVPERISENLRALSICLWALPWTGVALSDQRVVRHDARRPRLRGTGSVNCPLHLLRCRARTGRTPPARGGLDRRAVRRPGPRCVRADGAGSGRLPHWWGRQVVHREGPRHFPGDQRHPARQGPTPTSTSSESTACGSRRRSGYTRRRCPTSSTTTSRRTLLHPGAHAEALIRRAATRRRSPSQEDIRNETMSPINRCHMLHAARRRPHPPR